MKKHGFSYTFEYFTADTLDGVKKEYKQFVKTYHPDLHGAEEYDKYNALMGAVNEEYDFIINHWYSYTPAKHTNSSTTNTTNTTNTTENGDISEELKEVLYKLNNIEGININIVGSWIWVDGNTKPVKDQLKAAGLKWHSKKAMWFYAPADSKRKGYHGNTTFADNCDKYGCTSFKSRGQERITA